MVSGRCIPGSGNSQYKGPGVEMCLQYSGNNEEASMFGANRGGRSVGDNVIEVGGQGSLHDGGFVGTLKVWPFL